MSAHESLGRPARIYVASVIIAGSLAATHSLIAMLGGPPRPSWVVLAVLTLLSGSFTVRIPTIPARLSVSETFVFAAVLMFGPAAATVIVVLDALVISFWLGTRPHLSRLLFNVSAPAFAIWTASQAFYSITGIAPLSIVPQPVAPLIFPLLGLAVLYFLLNSWLVAFAVAFQKSQSAFLIWRRNLLWLSLNYFTGASVAALVLPYLLQLDYALLRIIGVLLPIFVVSYLTLKGALGRAEDANKHIGELSRLYLSTVETLAMAIDAKDQVTHGHIRRVQHYAIGLAKHLGVTDPGLIKAVEAASLLHDTGKLAIPEHILNKPGKLTPTEFEKMKAHASVGADILSAIAFPYPVIPIVRHHHENWDGTGYPDKLHGTDIPLGARILSVVDCFDALTSDRPYRGKLSEGEAISILLERRGSMYDPVIVDAFLSVHSQLAPETSDARQGVRQGLSEITRGVPPPHGVGQVVSSGVTLPDVLDSSLFSDFVRDFSSRLSLRDVCAALSVYLQRLLADTTCVVFIYDAVSDELRACHAEGSHAAWFRGLRIPRGERCAGWVAANQVTIINADAMLDLGPTKRPHLPLLTSCLSTPLVAHQSLVGVLSTYSARPSAFNSSHGHDIELLARLASAAVSDAVSFEERRKAFPTTRWTPRIASHETVQAFISAELAGRSDTHCVSVLLIDVLANSKDPSYSGLLARTVRTIAREVRRDDVIFQCGETELIVIVTGLDRDPAIHTAARISRRLRREPFRLGENLALVAIGVARAPDDGVDFASLVAAARLRTQPLDERSGTRLSVH